jgi:hypothetical protein
MYKPSWGNHVVNINGLPERPSMAVFERNLASILCFIRQSSPVVKIALCTLPPLGEDLSSRANKMVREANEIIERVAKSDDVCSVLPVFDRLESMIEKGNRRKKGCQLK